jgi:hypothetical protein
LLLLKVDIVVGAATNVGVDVVGIVFTQLDDIP